MVRTGNGALVTEPDVLLLDEVTSALEPGAAKDVEEWILRIHGERNTTIAGESAEGDSWNRQQPVNDPKSRSG